MELEAAAGCFGHQQSAAQVDITFLPRQPVRPPVFGNHAPAFPAVVCLAPAVVLHQQALTARPVLVKLQLLPVLSSDGWQY